jgi:LysM repeat protein
MGAQPSADPFERYVEKYREIALIEMQRAGIPASIKLGQALLESDAGRSDLARKANNHFGIKCNNDWDGRTFHKKDDDYDDQGEHIESCFRVYDDAEASFRAHSEFLLNPKKQFRYGQLFELDPTDYKGWAEGLRRAGYATSPNYSKQLISVIERYKLYKYDHLTSVAKSDRPIVSNGNSDTDLGGYLVRNDVKYVLSRANEPVEEIARRTHTPVRSLVSYNENLKTGTQRLLKDTKVYLQPKRSSYRGKETYHTVQIGETMFEIAQEYGLKLDKLYERNRLYPGEEPGYNERIKLRGGRVGKRPKIASEMPVLIPPTPLKDTLATTYKPTPPPVKTEPVKENPVVVVKQEKPQETLPEITPQQPGMETGTVTPTPEKPKPAQKPAPTTPAPEPANGGVAAAKPAPDTDFDDNIFENPKPDTTTAAKLPVITQFHTVVKGDTLWNISQRYNTSVDELKKLNNMTSNGIQLGQQLRVK